jgi:ABC transporter fused permease/ATP-binding protein
MTKPDESLFRRFLQFLTLARQEWKMLSLGLVFLFICTAMSLLYPQLFRLIIDNALNVDANAEQAGLLNQMVLMLLGSYVVYVIAGGFRYWIFTYCGEKMVVRLRSQLYQHMMGLEIGFFDQQQTGGLLSRLSSDTEGLQNTLSHDLSALLRYITMSIGGIGLLLYTSVPLALLLLLVIPPTAWFSGVAGNIIRRYSIQTQQAVANASDIAEETISGVRTVRSFVREGSETNRYQRALEQGLVSVKHRTIAIAAMEGCVVLSTSVAIVLILWIGAHQVIDGALTIGALTSFLLYTYIVTGSLTGMANLWAEFTKAVGAADRVFEIFNHTSADAKPGQGLQSKIAGEIGFNAVSFAYPSREDSLVLNQLSFSLQAGERMALVGPSGGGKSTIASLLSAFYRPSEGTITIDGCDLSQYDIASLRQQIAMVEQEPVIFSGSIGDNIRYGKIDATDEEVEQAAKAANADEFIHLLPQGYQTKVGGRGVQLSGGQKQRLAIARAVLKDPRILILDEATSALDAENEHLVTTALVALMHNRTTLIIAHRLSTVMNVDRVLVIEQGRVVQSGSHQQLSQDREGLYHRLATLQLS